jgi:UDP-N-acetylglucosamine--N-acetylmuramyl-(pentapeptide) pyrophosphoryl-undecaprenol N-acetylglucosamine transferase
MRVALCGGGTGGHVYPALAIAAALEEEVAAQRGEHLPADDRLEMLYLGASGGQETALVEQAGIPFQPIPSGPIRGRSPLELIVNTANMGRGTLAARKALGRFAAQVVLATGGYASFPVVLAARSRGLPTVVYLPDVYPGWTVKLTARLAQRVAISTAKALTRLPDVKTVVSGYPVRPSFWTVDRAQGREHLGVDPEEKLLLVAGASQGAHTINMAIAANLRSILELCEVIHLSGRRDEPELRQRRDDLPEGLRSRYHLFAYLNEEMPWAMAAADLALCRAGASILGELPAVGLPSILAPYPHAGGHQRHNAAYMEENAAATVVQNGDLARQILPLVGELLHHEQRLRSMSEAMRRLARPDAARNVAKLVLEAAVAP